MAINKTTQYTTDPNSIPVSISTGEQTLDDALEQRLTVSATAPSETFAYQRWWDTSVDQLKERSGDNLSWRIIAEVVSGELVPYSAGESVEDRYAGLAATNTFTSSNDFSSMPTISGDAIVESGSNTDGEWTRWADGTQIVASRGGTATTTDAVGNIFRSTSILRNFPVAFVGIPSVSVSAEHIDGDNGAWANLATAPTSTTATARFFGPSSNTQARLMIIAYGRWK